VGPYSALITPKPGHSSTLFSTPRWDVLFELSEIQNSFAKAIRWKGSSLIEASSGSIRIALSRPRA
jgi:hypothetical protein